MTRLNENVYLYCCFFVLMNSIPGNNGVTRVLDDPGFAGPTVPLTVHW